MIPQYTRQVAPEDRGRQYAGIAGRVGSGVGQAVAGLGFRVAEWAERGIRRDEAVAVSRAARDLDAWRLQYLRDLPSRRQNLFSMTIDESGSGQMGYHAELTAFPDALKAKYEEIAAGLSGGARQQFQMAFDAQAPQWVDATVRTLDKMEIEDVVGEARGLAREGRSAEASDLIEAYQDRLGAVQAAELQAQLAADGARADLQQIAATEGWEEARKTLEDANWQKTWGLDVQDAAGVRNALAGFVHDEAALAEVRQQSVLAANSDAFLVAAEKGQADLEAGLEMVARNELPFAVYEQGKKIMTTRVERDDPDVFEQLVRLQDQAARGAVPAAQVQQFVRNNAAGLTESTRKAAIERAGSPFSAQTQAKNDAVQRAYGQFVKIVEMDALQIGQLRSQGYTMEQINEMRDRRAQQLNLVNLVSDELESWLQKNPDATRADVLRRGREIQVLISDRAIEEQDSLIDAWQQGRPIVFAGGQGKGRMPAAAPSEPTAPAGLEPVWDSLSREEQASALRMVNRGVSASQILSALQGGR